MRLKTIKAKTVSEALLKAKAEAGDKALILETRKREGFAELLIALPDDKSTKRFSSMPANLIKTKKRIPVPLEEFGRDLMGKGLSETITKTIIDTIYDCGIGLDDRKDPAITRLGIKTLASLIKTEKIPSNDRKVVALVGPTGVGKTTTLAKLASISVLDESRDVAIITLDTYRLGAVEQLKAFADLLSVPMSVVFTPLDLKDALIRYKDVDRIFIDTPGRGPLDVRKVREIRAFIMDDAVDVLLCLPAGARLGDLRMAGRTFGITRPKGLIITKWDETKVYGDAVSYAVESGLPICWVTDGQEVPDDIQRCNPELISRAVIDGCEIRERREG